MFSYRNHPPLARRWTLAVLAALVLAATVVGGLFAQPAHAFEIISGMYRAADSPGRILDTRVGIGGPATRVGALQERTVQVAGAGGIPDGSASTAVVLNLTAVNPTAATHLTVWPDGQAKPTVSNINVPAGQTRANLVTVELPADGRIKVANNAGQVDILMDTVGRYYNGTDSNTNLYHPMVPIRAVDTRIGQGIPAGRVGAGGTINPKIAGNLGVPAAADSVAVNLTAVAPSQITHLTAWPAGTVLPATSTLNADAGATTPNLTIVKLGTDGRIDIRNNSGDVDVLVDVVGWYGTNGSLSFVPVAPTRVLDTRIGQGAPKAKVGAGQRVDVTIKGLAGLPVTGEVVPVINLTGVSPSSATHLTTGPAGVPTSSTSNLNLAPGQTAANLVHERLGVLGADTGRAYVYNNSGSTDVVADVFGYFAVLPRFVA